MDKCWVSDADVGFGRLAVGAGVKVWWWLADKTADFGYWIEDRIADAEPRHMIIASVLIALAFGFIGAALG